jgi:hypothetical protein
MTQASIGYRPGETTPVIADAAVTKYQAVIWASDGHVTDPVANNNDQAFAGFVYEEDIAANAEGQILERGEAIGIASGAITIGDLVQINDASGKLATASTTADDTVLVVGRAKSTAASDGDHVKVEILPGGMVVDYNA